MSKLGGVGRQRGFMAAALMVLSFGLYGSGPRGLGSGSGTSSSQGKAKVGGTPGYQPAKQRRGPGHGGSISRRKMQRRIEARKQAEHAYS